MAGLAALWQRLKTRFQQGEAPVLLLVGLGNPGDSYARTRHNIGFMAVDALAARHGLGGERRRYDGLCYEGRLGGQKVLALKPMTYMNRSGWSVRQAMQFYKLGLANIVVLHDDLDLPPGHVRTKTGGGPAGHNGLRSLDQQIGKDYRRIRLGIGHPGDKRKVTGYVLESFDSQQQAPVKAALKAVAEHAELLVAGQDKEFAARVNDATGIPAKGKAATPR